MCFFNAMSVKAINLADRYGKQLDLFSEEEMKKMENKYRIEAYSEESNFIITSDDKIQGMEWGLIPFWAKDKETAERIRMGTRNARAEDIFSKPSFRVPIMNKRCIIPCTGYYEYHYEKGKIDSIYNIFVKDKEVFSIAGIYDSWTDPATGEIKNTYSMLTIEANDMTGFIHNGGKHPNRMPLILSSEDEQIWLNPDLTKEEIQALFKTFPEDQMDAYKIDRKDFKKLNPHDDKIMAELKEKK